MGMGFPSPGGNRCRGQQQQQAGRAGIVGRISRQQGCEGVEVLCTAQPQQAALAIVGCSVSHSPTFPAWRSQEQEHINKRREKLIMISNNPINIKIKCRPINVTGTGSPGRSLPIPTCY